MYRFKSMKKIIPRTDEYMESGPISGSPKKGKEPKKYYPTIDIKHEFIPETKDWEVEKFYNVTFRLKMIGLSVSKFRNDSEFEIHGYDIVDNQGKGSDYKEDKD